MNSVRLCPIPYSQRPSNEYNNIKNSFKFSWTFQSSKNFYKSLMKSIAINYLIAYVITLNMDNKNAFINLKSIAELFLITSVLSITYLLQSYLACLYVYKRLMMSVVTYEESGWYDGQTWVKSKEVLVQDRLLGLYELRPIIIRLETVLYSFTSILGINLFVYVLN